MPYTVGDQQYRKRRKRAPQDAARRLTRETAAQTARELEYRATELTEALMVPDHPTHKHKWATGKEKWEAVQRAGRIAAGVEKVGGRRGPKPKSTEDRTSELLESVTSYMELVASGMTDLEAMRDSLVNQVNRLADSIEPTDLVVMRAALDM